MEGMRDVGTSNESLAATLMAQSIHGCFIAGLAGLQRAFSKKQILRWLLVNPGGTFDVLRQGTRNEVTPVLTSITGPAQLKTLLQWLQSKGAIRPSHYVAVTFM